MFKKILPFLFAAVAHAAPAEAVYVGAPTKKLAQQAARCAGVMAVAGDSNVANRHSAAGAEEYFEKFAIETIGTEATKSLRLSTMNSYRNESPSSKSNRLQADANACKTTIDTIESNRYGQDLTLCAGTALAADQHNLPIGREDRVKIAALLARAAIVELGDEHHVTYLSLMQYRLLANAGPSATRAAILNCQPVFNAAIEGIRTNPTGGPAVSPTGPR